MVALKKSERSSTEGYKNNSNNARIKKIRKNFSKLRYTFLRSKIKEIRKNLYEIENNVNLSESKMKEIDQNLIELEKSLHNLKKYHNYHDPDYREIRDIGNLFGEVDEGYYKPIKTMSAFNGNYVEYESNGGKDRNLSLKQYIYMINPYLRDIMNDHKTPLKLKDHRSNEVIDYETQFGEWKIQLIMSINFISSKDSNETRNTHKKSDNIESMMGSETDDILINFLNLFCKNIKKD